MGTLEYHDWHTPGLLAKPVYQALEKLPEDLIIGVTKNPEDLADTDKWIKVYGVSPEQTANVVIVQTRKTRHAEPEFAAVLVPASLRADLNGLVKHVLGASKVSFAPYEVAAKATGMESGGMSPIGLPVGWPILVDERLIHVSKLYLGSGIRPSKLVVDGIIFRQLSGAKIVPGLAK